MESFRAPVLRGLAWKAASRGVFEISKLVVAVVLARLLTPHDYGIAGMVLVIVAFEPVLSGTALASALVRRDHLTEEDRSTVFWTVTGMGLAFSLLGVALSGAVANFYGDPAVRPLFAALSMCFFISSLGMTQSALLVRAMDFRSLELRAMAGMVLGSALAIAAAARGYGAWALVVQQLAALSTSSLILWVRSDWRPRFIYSRATMRELRGFGTEVSGTLMLFQLTQNADNVLIGRYLGANALGAYALAYNVILVPFSRLASPLHEVLYPVFTRLQHDLRRLAAMWLRVVRMVAAVAMPLMAALVVVAPDAVDVVFGPKWHDAIPIVRILAWVGLLFVLQGLNSIVLQAVGRTRSLFLYAVASFAAALGSFVVGLHWGVVGVAACFAVVSTVVQPLYMRVTARAVGSGLRECLATLTGVALASLVLAFVTALAHRGLVAIGAGGLALLSLEVLAGLAAYAAVTFVVSREVVDELRALLGRRGRALTPRVLAGAPGRS